MKEASLCGDAARTSGRQSVDRRRRRFQCGSGSSRSVYCIHLVNITSLYAHRKQSVGINAGWRPTTAGARAGRIAIRTDCRRIDLHVLGFD